MGLAYFSRVNMNGLFDRQMRTKRCISQENSFGDRDQHPVPFGGNWVYDGGQPSQLESWFPWFDAEHAGTGLFLSLPSNRST